MNPCIHLVVGYFNASEPERAAEYDECLRRNLENPGIDSVHCLLEPGTIVPQEFRVHAKYREGRVAKWLTYRDAFDYANRNLAGNAVCIANLDIFLDARDSDWRAAAEIVESPIVFALSRIEFNADGTTFEDPGFAQAAFAWSQDAWLFQAPIEVPDCDFEIGTLGCDNAIAHRFKRAGRLPVNAPGRFKIFHYDRCRGKTSANQYAIHKHEREARGLPITAHPEQRGTYFVPDIDQIGSIDGLLESLHATDLQRYEVFCEIVSRFIKVPGNAAVPPPPRVHPDLLFPIDGSGAA